MKMTKRPATEADLPYLMWLRRKTMDDHLRASGETPTNEYHAQRLHYRYDCADVLVQDNRAVGLLKVARDPGEWEIIQIQLDPSLHGQGVGRTLLEEVISGARSAGANLTLKVLTANPARKLYEELGFEACGIEGNEVRMRLRSRG